MMAAELVVPRLRNMNTQHCVSSVLEASDGIVHAVLWENGHKADSI